MLDIQLAKDALDVFARSLGLVDGTVVFAKADLVKYAEIDLPVVEVSIYPSPVGWPFGSDKLLALMQRLAYKLPDQLGDVAVKWIFVLENSIPAGQPIIYASAPFIKVASTKELIQQGLATLAKIAFGIGVFGVSALAAYKVTKALLDKSGK